VINEIEEYLNENGYYGNIDEDLINSIAFTFADKLCLAFSDKDGEDMPDDVFIVVMERIEGLLCS